MSYFSLLFVSFVNTHNCNLVVCPKYFLQVTAMFTVV